MLNFLKKILGSQQERTLARLQQKVKAINAYYETLRNLSHDALRQETEKIRAHIAEKLAPSTEAIQALKKTIKAEKEISKQEPLFEKLDQLQEEQRLQREKILTENLVKAFAIMKETARRFTSDDPVEVTATSLDQELAKNLPHITLKGDKAYYETTWDVGGNLEKWNMVHFDVQLMGGISLHEGKIAEMRTGEGKTLVATLPVFLNALAQDGVHVVTVNSYLSERDANWMGPLYQFHGLTVGCIGKHEPYSKARKAAYLADITYGTNSDFGFDYLRDNMADSVEEQVQRGHNYAIVDEIDQVLLDEGRTPLIMSGPVKEDNSKEYQLLKPRIEILYKAQRKLVEDLLQEAKKQIADGKNEEGGLNLFRAYRGLPKHKPLIQYLSERGIKQILSSTEEIYLQENKKKMPEADAPLFFTVEDNSNSINITNKGIEYLTEQQRDPEFFILPNIALLLADIENDESLSLDEKVKAKKDLETDFTLKSGRLHAVNQLLKAYVIFDKNIDYVVMGGRVKLVDQKTGRIMEGRRFSGGLHKALEAKEGVAIEKTTETYAMITSQNQFRMYKKLAGMTGTAATESEEFWSIYKLEVVIIPPNRPIQRVDLNDQIYKTQHEKYNAIKKKVEEFQKTGRPILIITPSVEVSELLRKKLGISAKKVLNAKNHHLEAAIIAQAGQEGSITIATQMAGRGTDIKLSEGARQKGGLLLINVEKHETRRVNNQIDGRAGRQGDPGTTYPFLSLEDPLIVHFKHGFIGKQVDNIFEKEGELLEHKQISKAILTVQKNRERDHYMSRKRALDYDNVLGTQREIIYKKRNYALQGERLALDIQHMLYGSAKELLEHQGHSPQGLEIATKGMAGITYKLKSPLHHVSQRDVAKLYHHLSDHLQKVKKELFKGLQLNKIKDFKEAPEAIAIPFESQKKLIWVHIELPKNDLPNPDTIWEKIEQRIVLETLDHYWQRHLQGMADLKDMVRNATYENKDPLLVYKFEGIKLFKKLLEEINKTCIQHLCHLTLPAQEKIKAATADFLENHDHEAYTATTFNPMDEGNTKPKPIQVAKTIGRNDKVTVKYTDGTLKKKVKYKLVESDLQAGKCELIQKDAVAQAAQLIRGIV